MIRLPRRTGGLLLALAALSLAARIAAAQSTTTCADDFRSGKLYFSQALNEKSVERFAAAVAACPEKGEYHARYAMALCQRGDELLNEAFTQADTKEVRDAKLEAARKHYRLAGSEFDTAGVVEDKKSILKFVRENRDHYWVEHYNRGLGFMKTDEGKPGSKSQPAVAAVEFEIARLISPQNPKAYGQGAVALLTLDRRDEAMEVVKRGLVISPGDKELEDLLGTIYQSAAEEYLQRAQENRDPQKAAEAEKLVNILLERKGDDANLYFMRGILRATRASALSDSLPDEAKGLYRSSAEDFSKAASLVPPEKDKQFHLDALLYQTQGHVNAGDCDASVAIVKSYLALNYAEPVIWKFMSLCLIEKQEQQQGVAALMVSKSLEGGVIADTPEEVQVTVKDATDDAAAALAQQGSPEFVYGYQEQSSGNQIQTWFWPAKRSVMSFILGKKNGEISW